MTGQDVKGQDMPDPPVDRALIDAFDLRDLPPSFYDDPYPYYDALRVFDPVRRLPDGGYFLSRYQDCLAVYKDPHRFSSDKKVEFKPKFGDSPLFEHHTTSLVFNDPPLHSRVRRLLAGALTPRVIAAMEPDLIALVDHLLDAMATRRQVDLIEDFAAAIPIEVIGNLLAVPRDQRHELRGWSLAILGALEPALTPRQFERGVAAVEAFTAFLRELVDHRRRHPGDPDQDLLTRLILGEAGGETLSEKELLQNCIFILNAGHETTTNLIGNGLVTLAAWPQEKRRLIDHPGLIDSAIEEFLRFESSNQLGNRITTAPVELGGVEMAAGTSVHIGIGAANRDPAIFDRPNRLDIGRRPNRHLAFGSGVHQCVGMSLARLEGRIAIGRFMKAFPDFRLIAPPTRGGRVRFRGFLRIPAVLNTRR